MLGQMLWVHVMFYMCLGALTQGALIPLFPQNMGPMALHESFCCLRSEICLLPMTSSYMHVAPPDLTSHLFTLPVFPLSSTPVIVSSLALSLPLSACCSPNLQS